MDRETEEADRADPSNTSQNANPYDGIYEKLSKHPRQIRVLKFVESSSDLVSVELKTIHLDDEFPEDLKAVSPGRYEALSYVWGDPKLTTDIELNGRRVPVTINLADALRQFQIEEQDPTQKKTEYANLNGVELEYDQPDLRLWADALCINQQDSDERGHQVAIMRDIYKNAYRVRAWLGNMPDGVAHALRRLFKQATNIDKPRDAFDTISSTEERHSIQAELQSMLDPGETPYEFTECLRPFQTAEYWSRKWIIQELVFARSMRFYFGASYLDATRNIAPAALWYNVFTFVATAANLGWERQLGGPQGNDLIEVFRGIAKSIQHVIRAMACVQSNEDREANLLLVETMRELNASDPRDCVFAVQGFLHKDFYIAPNYSIKVEDLFVQFAVHVASAMASLTILDQACSTASDLPSWVPDLRTESKSHIRISENQAPSALEMSQFTCPQPHVLAVRGIELGRIAQAPNVIALRSCTARERVQQWYDAWSKAYNFAYPRENDLASSNAFWSALDPLGVRLYSLKGNYTPLIQRLNIILRDKPLPAQDELVTCRIFERFTETYTMIFTDDGRIGSASARLPVPLPGDMLLAIASAESLFCARPISSKAHKTFELVNSCCIDGIMEGEAVKEKAKQRVMNNAPQQHFDNFCKIGKILEKRYGDNCFNEHILEPVFEEVHLV